MRILGVEFVGAIGQIGQAPPELVRDLPQVAFAGRSNVGKSSLINRLLGRTRTAIARVSGEPGKTQEINFYRVRSDRGDFVLVDLPGYGYARAPQELRARWEPLIRGHLSGTPALAGVVQLVDSRHGPTPDDLRAVDYLAEIGVPALFVLTKIDKLNRSRREATIRTATAALSIEPEQTVAFSSLSGEGREDLLDTLEGLLFGTSPAPEEARAASG